MAETLKLCAQDFPEIEKRLDAFNRALEYIDEKDESGNLTRRAHDARALLRSPLIDLRPYKRAKAEVGKQLGKYKAKAETAIAHALVAYTLYKQWQLEYDLLDDKDDATKLVPKSREEHNREGILKIAEPFVYDLIGRGVSPSAISRRRQSEIDVIASLITWSHNDPKFEDPDNPWPVLAKSGYYAGYTNDLTEDEARALDLAWQLRSEAAKSLLEKTREFLPRDLVVSSDVAMGAARLMDAHAQLPDGLAQLYADAYDLVRDKDLVALGKLFQFQSEEELLKLHVLANFLRRQDIAGSKELPVWLKVDLVSRFIDNTNADTKPPSDWLPGFLEKLKLLAENFSSRLDSEEAFNALMHAGMRMSSTFDRFERDADIRASKERELLRLRTMRDAVEQGLEFKIDQFGFPVTAADDDFEALETKVYRVSIRPAEIASSSDILAPGYGTDRPDSSPIQSSPSIAVSSAADEYPQVNDDAPDPQQVRTAQNPNDEDDEGEEFDFYAVARGEPSIAVADSEEPPGVAAHDVSKADPPGDDAVLQGAPPAHYGTEVAAGSFSEWDQSHDQSDNFASAISKDGPADEMTLPPEIEAQILDASGATPLLETVRGSDSKGKTNFETRRDEPSIKPIPFDRRTLPDIKDEDML
ncbi:hypothetical protein [Roseibium sp.]|uniref:hypothetical protein n=1 Tax=Roseibium sp. TaxID=1936156 RepID=UPI003298BCFE